MTSNCSFEEVPAAQALEVSGFVIALVLDRLSAHSSSEFRIPDVDISNFA